MVGKKYFVTKRRLGIAGLAAALLLPGAALFMHPAAGQVVGQPGSGAENQSGGNPHCFQTGGCVDSSGNTCPHAYTVYGLVDLSENHSGAWQANPDDPACGYSLFGKTKFPCGGTAVEPCQ